MRSQTLKGKKVDSFATRYLERVMAELGIKTDYRLAHKLGVSPQAIYKIRAGGAMGATIASRIAYLLKLENPYKIIAECEMERGADDALFWRNVRDTAGFAFALIGGAVLTAYAMSDLTITELWGVSLVALTSGGGGAEYALGIIAAMLALGSLALYAARRAVRNS